MRKRERILINKQILTKGILSDQIRSGRVYTGLRQSSDWIDVRRSSDRRQASVLVGLVNNVSVRTDGTDQFRWFQRAPRPGPYRRRLARRGGLARRDVFGTARLLVVELMLDRTVVVGMKKGAPAARSSIVIVLKWLLTYFGIKLRFKLHAPSQNLRIVLFTISAIVMSEEPHGHIDERSEF